MSRLYTIEELTKNIFYIGKDCVDVKRGTITFAQTVHTLEPKVMSVLLHLAANAGQVVEQEALFAKVWPNSIYSPGSIRRCITILRKIFKDDTKSIIATHPKRGYSFNAPIQFMVEPAQKVNITLSHRILFSMLLLCFISFYLWYGQTTVPTITDSRPITSTKQIEDFAQISPDGQYIAYVRHPMSNHLEGHIWLKDLSNDAEYQLTTTPIYARNLSWHADSKALLYVSVKKKGLDIIRMSIDFDEMKSKLSVILKRPELNWISSLVWGPNSTLYYIAKKDSKMNLFSFSLSTGEHKVLLAASKSFDPFELALANNQEQLALIGRYQGHNSQIRLLSVKQLEKDIVDVTQELMLDTGHYAISWHPSDSSLLLNDGKQLYHLDLSGKMNKILYENFHFIRFAHFAPDGNSIAIISEKLDIDIWLSSLNNNQPNTLVYDSNSMDRDPKFSPTGDRFAFITTSKGYPQLYIQHLTTGKNQLIYENEEQGLGVSPPQWNALGNKLAFAIEGQPIIITLNNTEVIIKHLNDTQGIPLQWYQNENSVLLKVHEQAVPHFAKLDLTSRHLTKVIKQNGNSAYLNTDDELLLVSKQSIDKRLAAGSLKNIRHFNGQILRAYHTVKGLYLYVKSQDNFALWFYSFSQQSTTRITHWDSHQRIVDIDSTGNFALIHTVKMEKDIIFLTVQ